MKYILFVFLAACGASGPKAVYTPTGAVGYQLECKKNVENCLAEAGTLCQSKGYTVIHSDSHAGGILADALPGPVTWYNLTVQCGN